MVTLVVGFVPVKSPSHCRNVQPGAGVAVTTAVPLLNHAPAGGSTATLPPPAIVALKVGRMMISTGPDCTACVKAAL